MIDIKYKTIMISRWDTNRIYCYDFTNNNEIIEESTLDEIINKYNQEGYYLSAINSKRNETEFYMTKSM